ncbi:APC family permease [Arthrobacter sp. NQ7]|uniref:APC family permease n=1 Tax=Arthrobacter sp. NQ7 TaxID=3032303 RepID=UPI00240E9D49|nr:APC family permease [Arthrobacter sp. NQ7]MDJ0459842.1 APC family permease [Arthrobacter sp. NQ7]
MSDQHSSSFGLAESGYKQSLKRGTIHKFAMFAISYAFISVLVGATSLTGFGFGQAGPAFWWTWIGVSVGQLAVAFLFAEVSAEYPFAGSVYNWARKITSPLTSWLSGYLLLWSYVIAVAGVALTLNVVLPQISTAFNIVDDPGLNGFIIGTIAVVISTIFNMMKVRVAGWINTSAVVLELAVIVALIVGFLFHIQRGPEIVTETAGTGSSGGTFALAILVAVAAPAWVLAGFDSAGTLAEESANPRLDGPRAIVRSVAAAVISGILLVLAMLMALPKDDVTVVDNVAQGGLPYAIKIVMGDEVGNLLLYALAAAVFAAVVAIQHGTARMMFAMGRDNNLPFGAFLSRVNKRQSPAEAAIVIGVIGIALMSLSLVSPEALAALASVSIVLVYLGYLCLTVPLLRRRFARQWPIAGATGQQYFSLGRWGLLINIVAVVWGALGAFDLAWPWPAIYDPTGSQQWYLLYLGWIMPAVLVVVGIIWFQTYQRHRTGIVAAHRVEPITHETSPSVKAHATGVE